MALVWQCELPARVYHNLTEEARDQLLELLPDTQVCFGRPGDEAQAERGKHDVIGSVVDAWPLPHRRVGVRIRLQDHDETAVECHRMLEEGSCIVGLDMTGTARLGQEWEGAPDGKLVNVYAVKALRSLEVVPTDSDPRYTPPLDPPAAPPEDEAPEAA